MTRSRPITTCFLAFALSALATGAMASSQNGGQNPDRRVLQSMSAEEAAEAFRAADTNRDGFVDRQEWTSRSIPSADGKMRPGSTFPFFDTDRDGRLTRAEYIAAISGVEPRGSAGAPPSPGRR